MPSRTVMSSVARSRFRRCFAIGGIPPQSLRTSSAVPLGSRNGMKRFPRNEKEKKQNEQTGKRSHFEPSK